MMAFADKHRGKNLCALPEKYIQLRRFVIFAKWHEVTPGGGGGTTTPERGSRRIKGRMHETDECIRTIFTFDLRLVRDRGLSPPGPGAPAPRPNRGDENSILNNCTLERFDVDFHLRSEGHCSNYIHVYWFGYLHFCIVDNVFHSSSQGLTNSTVFGSTVAIKRACENCRRTLSDSSSK